MVCMKTGRTRPLGGLLVLLLGCGSPAQPVTAPTAHAHPQASAAAPHWSMPSCPLRYEIRTLETTKMSGAGEGVQLVTFIDLRAVPRDSFLELTSTVTAEPSMGSRRYRSFTQPSHDYAPVHLRTDGRSWAELDGPTMVWKRFGTQGGIERLFPKLPESATDGARTTWQIDFPTASETCVVESARGKHAGLTREACTLPAGASVTPVPSLVAEVKLERWTEVGGLRAAVVTMKGTEVLDPPNVTQFSGAVETRVSMRGRVELRGEYVVLSTGRILRATVEKNVHVDAEWTTEGKTDKPSTIHGHQKTELRLVEACDGPVEASLVVPLSREERAIEALGETVLAIASGDREKALRGFDTELRNRHGDDALWSTLSTYKADRSAQALPVPVLVRDEQVRTDGDVVHLVLGGTTPHLMQANTVTPVTCDVALRETGGQPRVVSMRCDLETEKANLLVIDSARLDVVTTSRPPCRSLRRQLAESFFNTARLRDRFIPSQRETLTRIHRS